MSCLPLSLLTFRWKGHKIELRYVAFTRTARACGEKRRRHGLSTKLLDQVAIDGEAYPYVLVTRGGAELDDGGLFLLMEIPGNNDTFDFSYSRPIRDGCMSRSVSAGPTSAYSPAGRSNIPVISDNSYIYQGACRTFVQKMIQSYEVDYAAGGEGVFDMLCAARQTGRHRVLHGHPHHQAHAGRYAEIHHPAGGGQPFEAAGGAGESITGGELT